MHESVMNFVSQCVDRYNLHDKTVLDAGSMDINGNARELFSTSRYIGIDMLPGKNVDIVMNSHELKFPDKYFDVVLSLECIEHDDQFWVSMKEIGRVLRPGGVLILTTRSIGFQYHPYPYDYWRFTLDSAGVLCNIAGLSLADSQSDPQAPGIFIVGVKGEQNADVSC